MVGQADFAAKQFTHMRNGENVGVAGGGRVSAGALEQNQVLAPGLTGGAYCVIELGDTGHAGGDDHRFAGGGDAADQRQVGVLK